MLRTAELDISAGCVAEGSSRCACSQSLWLWFSRVLERWSAAAWTSGFGAVRCKGAVGGGESD